MCETINTISYIRVISIISVFLLHASLFSTKHGFIFSDKTWFLQTPAWGAVWTFFFLSGFLNGRNFWGSNKYSFSLNSICKFYVHRFFRVVFPTWVFLFVNWTIIEPEIFIDNPNIWMEMLMLRYTNILNDVHIGATWYVFSLSWLYIFTPILCWMLQPLLNKRICIGMLMGLFIILGYILRSNLIDSGVDWVTSIYTPFYCNFDLYIVGILVSMLACNYSLLTSREKLQNRYGDYRSALTLTINLKGILLFLILIMINTRIYYIGFIRMYQMLFPSLYIIVLSSICLLFNKKEVLCPPAFLPINFCVNSFSFIGFEFYLFHSMVMAKISPYIVAGTPNYFHFKLILITFIITSIISIVYKKGYNFASVVLDK